MNFLHIGGSLNGKVVRVPLCPEKYRIAKFKKELLGKDFDPSYSEKVENDYEIYRKESFRVGEFVWYMYILDSMSMREAMESLLKSEPHKVLCIN